MNDFCKICGTEKVNGVCPNAESHLKKMCLNCESCVNETDTAFCNNPDNLNDAVEKIKQNIPSGYSLENIELKPLPLKDPTKKCKRWKLNVQSVLNEFEKLA